MFSCFCHIALYTCSTIDSLLSMIASTRERNDLYTYLVPSTKSRLAIRVLNYCKPHINAKRLNDVMATEARGFITCTLSGC